ncbi:MAG: DUF1997 domain-containing protein [Chlorobium phaeobacteroides]|uniref:Cyclase/dehydrase n=1 Tax=Chlorobium phaeobacteroides (strain BS1) TaxID=331678 RepID=B3EL15_CHLPB|nr:DUF1997 domain-containing protein [Chlorobium phaeobacteroides]
MKVVGKSKAVVTLEACLNDSATYFSDHEKILNCNPYCKNVSYIRELDIFQWTFEVDDPRNHPIVAIFFVRQTEELVKGDSESLLKLSKKNKNGLDLNRPVTKIRWRNAETIPKVVVNNNYTFIGKTNSEIFLQHQENNLTTVHFETDISLDFTLSFPLNLMPENILKLMSEKMVSRILQQATESMLCKVQSDICCSVPEIKTEGNSQ